jgi:hypothetical protein
VVRLAGMPVRALSALRFPETAAAVTALLDRDDVLARDAVSLADKLHDLIGVADPALKPSLLGLRRAVHNRRRPHRREWNADIECALGARLSRRLNDWLDACSRWQDRRDELPAILNAETASKQVELRELVADPTFRRGLSHSSIPLLDRLDTWLRDPDRTPSRAVQFRLAKYLARAATKTSPYSTFTMVGTGRWEAGPDPVRPRDGGAPRGVLDLNDLLLGAVVRGLRGVPGLRDSLLVRINPSLLADDGQLTFLGGAPGEPLVTVPATPTVRRCLELVETLAPATAGTVRAELAREGGDSRAADRFLARLAEIGLLEMRPPTGGEPYAVDALAEWVDGHDYPELARLLRQMHADLRSQVAITDLAAHRATEESLRAGVRRLLALVAAESGAEPEVPSSSHRAAAVTMDTVVAPRSLAGCGTEAWRPLLRDLDAVRRWFGIFDLRLPLRVALGEWWAEHLPHDARLPFLRLHRLLQEEVAAGSALGIEVHRLMSGGALLLPAPVGGGRLAELARLRAEAVQPFQAGRTPLEPVQVEPQVLEKLADAWPSWVSAPASLGCYLQPLPAAGDRPPEAVLHSVHIGYGKGRSRAARLIERAGGEPGNTGDTGNAPPAPSRSGPVLAEPGGCFGFALNERAPAAPFEIDYPFTASARPAGERLLLNDLLVCYDHGQGMLRLRSQRLGREVRVAHLGMLAHALLPPALRLLVGLSCPEPPWMPAWLFRHNAGDPPPPGEVALEPRLVAGGVVLRRARWVTATATVPVRGGGESDAGYLLRLARWRRRHGIPERCFLRAPPRLPDERLGGEQWRRLVRTRKPVYVDFGSWFLVLALENMLRSAGDLVIVEEALPDPGAAPAGQRVCELLVEINGTGAV